MNDKTYKGCCFCGAVQFTVTGEPAAMGEAAARHAQQYSWRNIAADIVDVYDAQIAGSRGPACTCG